MVKITASLLFLGGCVNAFTISYKNANKRSFVNLQGITRPDSSDAITDAIRISKEFGYTSSEAKVAWDIVEELDSSDMSPAIGYSIPKVKEMKNEMDYKNQVNALAYLMAESKEKLEQMEALVNNIKRMELEDPALSKLPEEASGLKKVLAEAKAAMEVYGPNSAEAKVAWDNVESCADGYECSVESMYRYSAAAIKAHHYYDAVLDSTLLQESVDAFEAINALRRFVNVENGRLGNNEATP